MNPGDTGEKVLGVLGGMGPLASAQFMLRLTLLTPAARDQDHIPAVLWSDPRVPDRTRGKLAGGDDPLPWLLRGIAGLKRAGCGAIAIPCNTAHGWYDAMQEAAGHADPAHRRCGRGRPAPLRHRPGNDRRDGHAGRRWPCGSIRTGCTRRAGTASFPPRTRWRSWSRPAIAQVKANRVAEAYAPLAEVVNSLAARGAAAVVLGCTEIPLGIQAGPQERLRVPVVDTIDALARAAIAWARG